MNKNYWDKHKEEKRKSITRNIVRGKLNVKCVSVRLGNVIGQDIW